MSEAVAIAQSELSGPSVDLVGVGSEFGERLVLQLARPRKPDDLAAASRSRRDAEDRVPQALESGNPAKIDIHVILAAWRATERALGVIPEGSLEWARVHARLISLRASYHQLFAERCDRPPSPEAPRRFVDRPEFREVLQPSG